jgi:23S rRNA pseudouridine1911/1915/1917 synthase
MGAQHRVDHWVGQRFPGLTRNQVLEAIEAGLVRAAGGGQLRKGDRVLAGREPDCARLEEHLRRLAAGNPGLDVPLLLETEALVAVDKPPGMPSHPVHLADFDTVTHWALRRYPEIRSWATDSQPTVTPHRLDTGTSGVLLVARTAAAFDRWRRRFSRGEVEKRYLAWCWGSPGRDRWAMGGQIGHAPGERGRMAVTRTGGRRAVSEAEVIRQLPDRFLCELVLRTGVTHQVRVHMAACGHPLLGDRLYDPAFGTRIEQPAHPLLRAVAISCGDFGVAAPREDFVAQFGG